MKFDTKKCSPVILPSMATGTSSSRGLDGRDLVWRNSNPFLSSEDEDENETETENEDDSRDDGAKNTDRNRKCNRNSYGRRIEHLPRLVYTPVKVSARRSSNANSTRTITNQEMDDLNASLMNLSFRDDDENENAGASSTTSARESKSTYHMGDHMGREPLFGRIAASHLDSKSGKTTTVWRSARVAKKISRA